DAHCDVPCGIYDPAPATIAANTVLTMTQKILDLKVPGANASDDERRAYTNTVTRMISTKEEHAHIAKREVLILWTDYFKPEHLSKYPDLHDMVWKTTKLCSKSKQEVNLQAAQDLVASVKKIADTFWDSKK